MKRIEAKLIGEHAETVIVEAICDICGSNCLKSSEKTFEGRNLKLIGVIILGKMEKNGELLFAKIV